MRYIGRIDRRIYACIAEEIASEEVVITERQIEHCNLHDFAFDRYRDRMAEALAAPDYIIEDKRDKTGIIIKRLLDERGHTLLLVLRVKTSSDPEEYSNSIISCWDINETRLKNYLRNKKILYTRPGNMV